jgi:hypothetical protein
MLKEEYMATSSKQLQVMAMRRWWNCLGRVLISTCHFIFFAVSAQIDNRKRMKLRAGDSQAQKLQRDDSMVMSNMKQILTSAYHGRDLPR